MNPYLMDTEYAAKGLFELALSGDTELKRLSQVLQSANAGFAMNVLDAASIESNEDLDSDEDSLEDEIDAAYARAGQFHQHATALKTDIERLDKEVVDKDTALQTLSGAILQIANKASQLCTVVLRTPPSFGSSHLLPSRFPPSYGKAATKRCTTKNVSSVRGSRSVFASCRSISGRISTWPPIQAGVAPGNCFRSLAGRTTSRT